jgi:hypothetical protein
MLILPHHTEMASEGNFLTFSSVLTKFGCSLRCCDYDEWSAQSNAAWHNQFTAKHELRKADDTSNINGIPIEMLPTTNMQRYLTNKEYGQFKEMSRCLTNAMGSQRQAEVFFDKYQNLLKYFSRDAVPDIPLYIALLLSARLNSTHGITAVVPDIRRYKRAGYKSKFVCGRRGTEGYKHYAVQRGVDVVVTGDEFNKYLTLEQEQAVEQQQQQDDNIDSDDDDNDNDNDIADNTESDADSNNAV